MQGLIQSAPLTVDRILRHAATVHGQAEVVTAAAEGGPRRISYAVLETRVRRLAGALAESGIGKGDVVAVIGASTARQLEAWFAIMTVGAVCHPINSARSPEHAAALMRAHGDKAVLVDPDLLQGLEPSLLKLPQLERVIAMGEAGQVLATRMHAVVSQDALMETAGRTLNAAVGEEGAPALLLHSAGVAESPKTALWSHRACVLHGLAAQGPDGLEFAADDSVLLLTPFWRYGGGGMLFAAPLAGARLVLPGQKTDVQSVRILADREAATVVVGSPAELQALHDQFRSEGRRPTALKRVIATGAPSPGVLARAWRDNFAVEVWSAWGSAEVAGVAAVARGASGLSPLFGVELELVDADGRPRRGRWRDVRARPPRSARMGSGRRRRSPVRRRGPKGRCVPAHRWSPDRRCRWSPSRRLRRPGGPARSGGRWPARRAAVAGRPHPAARARRRTAAKDRRRPAPRPPRQPPRPIPRRTRPPPRNCRARRGPGRRGWARRWR